MIAMTFHHYPNGSAGAIGAAIRQARRHLCARLADMADSNTPDDCFVRAFPSVVAAVEVGFRQEEMAMESLDYERLHAHRAENATILAALHRALPLVEDGDVMLGRQLVAALLDLLSLHRLSTDLALATAPRAPVGRSGGRVARILPRGGAHAGPRSRQH